MKPKEIIKILQNDGWRLDRIAGSHYIFKYSDKPGMPTVPYHNKDLKPGTLNKILRQAGLK